MEDHPITSQEKMIFFLRHAERADCAENEEFRSIEILLDPHITKLGKFQAKFAGVEIESVTKSQTKYLVVSSPFLRCLQTANELVKVFGKERIIGQKIYMDNFLAEFLNSLYFSSSPMNDLYVYTKPQEIKKKYLDIEVQNGLIGEGNHTLDIKYSETPNELYDRVTRGYSKALELYSKILQEEKNTTLILVTHGYGVQFLLDHYDAFDLEKGVDYTCLSQVFYDSQTNRTKIGRVQIHDQLEKAEKEYRSID